MEGVLGIGRVEATLPKTDRLPQDGMGKGIGFASEMQRHLPTPVKKYLGKYKLQVGAIMAPALVSKGFGHWHAFYG